MITQRVRSWSWWNSTLAFSSKVFYFCIYSLYCLSQTQEVSVCNPSGIVEVADSLRRSILPGRYCMGRWCSVFLKPLCSFLWRLSITPPCFVLQNLSWAKLSKPKWKSRTGLLPSGVWTVLVTISKTKILILFFYLLISMSHSILYWNKKYRHSWKFWISECLTHFLLLPFQLLSLTEHNLKFPRDSFLLKSKALYLFQVSSV